MTRIALTPGRLCRGFSDGAGSGTLQALAQASIKTSSVVTLQRSPAPRYPNACTIACQRNQSQRENAHAVPAPVHPGDGRERRAHCRAAEVDRHIDRIEAAPRRGHQAEDPRLIGHLRHLRTHIQHDHADDQRREMEGHRPMGRLFAAQSSKYDAASSPIPTEITHLEPCLSARRPASGATSAPAAPTTPKVPRPRPRPAHSGCAAERRASSRSS